MKNRNSNVKVSEKSNGVTGCHFGQFSSQMNEISKKVETNKAGSVVVSVGKVENK